MSATAVQRDAYEPHLDQFQRHLGNQSLERVTIDLFQANFDASIGIEMNGCRNSIHAAGFVEPAYVHEAADLTQPYGSLGALGMQPHGDVPLAVPTLSPTLFDEIPGLRNDPLACFDAAPCLLN